MKIDTPLLDRWPKGYEHGRFYLVTGAVVIRAKGKPMLRLKEPAPPELPAPKGAKRR